MIHEYAIDHNKTRYAASLDTYSVLVTARYAALLVAFPLFVKTKALSVVHCVVSQSLYEVCHEI